MNDHKLRQIAIKKIQLLIDKKIGDLERLEQMQLKVARCLPMFAENQAYLNGLILENLTEEEIQSIIQDVESTKLEKSDMADQEMFHCICCGNATKKLDGGGMCTNCYLDYNIKISKFVTRLPGGGTSIAF